MQPLYLPVYSFTILNCPQIGQVAAVRGKRRYKASCRQSCAPHHSYLMVCQPGMSHPIGSSDAVICRDAHPAPPLEIGTTGCSGVKLDRVKLTIFHKFCPREGKRS